MIIGSAFWRLLNYGPRAMVKHVYFSLNEIRTKTPLPINVLRDLEEKLEIQNLWMTNDEENFNKYFQELHRNLMQDRVKDVFSAPTFTRVIVLATLLKSRKFDSVLETGTQNGISISLLNQFITMNNLNSISLFTFDVCEMPKKIESNTNYINLRWPARINFKRLTAAGVWNNSIFFHDSDHSEENMTFEFNYAWEKLKVKAIVSDDVENNDAFSKFCKRVNLRPYYFKFDKGPAVGVVLRNSP
jgi:hypothetical protein